jgi:hypothetical protein
MTCCSLYVWAAASIEAGHEQATQDVRGTIAPQSSDICDDANSLGDLISEFAGETWDPKQALALAACAHEIAVLLLGSTIFGRVFRKGGGHD